MGLAGLHCYGTPNCLPPKLGDNFCATCGAGLDYSQLYCNSCQKHLGERTLDPKFRFCPGCGKSVDSTEVEAKTESAELGNSGEGDADAELARIEQGRREEPIYAGLPSTYAGRV